MSDEKSTDGNLSAKPNYFVHQTSIVDDGAQIGEGTSIWHFSNIMKDAQIGRKCIIGQNVFVGSVVKIGNCCKIQNNVSLYKGVIIEDDVFCGPSCVFTNVYNPRAFIERKHEFRPTLFKKGTTVGANATIICGVTIGRYALIGAGAVVKENVPDYALVVGIPAKQIGWICKCGIKLKDFDSDKTTKCESCGCKYILEDNRVIMLEEK